jgi:hypothetical protein
MSEDPPIYNIVVNSSSVLVTAVVEYLGEGINMVYTSAEGWQIDQEIDHYSWEEWQIDGLFELCWELPTPRVVLE